MSCSGCVQEARERNAEMNNLLTVAKQQAIETNEPKAICQDEINGLFITDAATAFRQHFYIKDIVSPLQ